MTEASHRFRYTKHARIQRGVGAGAQTPTLKNHKNIGFLSNTGLDLLKNHKATKSAFAGGPMLAC